MAGWKDAPVLDQATAPGSAWQAAPVVAGKNLPPKQPPAGRGRGGVLEKADAFVRGAADSIGLGFADEIAAGLNTVLPLDKGSRAFWQPQTVGGMVEDSMRGNRSAYEHNLQLQRDRDKYDSQNSGNTRLAGQVAGAVAPAVVGGLVATGGRAAVNAGRQTAARVIRRAAATGATGGGVAGFGGGEGGFGNRAESALGGAVVGAATGGALGGAVELAPRVANLLGQFTMRYPRAEAVAQTLRALQRDGLSLPQAQAAIDRYANMGKPAVLGDLGANLRARAGVAARSPGRSQVMAREVLDRRQAGQGERLVNDIRQTISPRVDVHAADDELLQQALAQAAPLYESAYAAPGVSSETIDGILQTPAGRSALGRAHNIAANEGRDPTSLGIDLDGEGNAILTRVPSVQTLDYVKRGLDDIIESGPRHPMTGRPILDEGSRAINGVRSRLVNEMDRLNPDYAAARRAYAGPSQARDALAEGRRFGQMDPEAIAATQGRRDAAGQDMFRVGAARSLTDTVNKANPRGIRAAGIASTPQQLAQLRAMGANADELARRTAAERELSQLNGELQGSQTDYRRLASEDANLPALPSTIRPLGLLTRAASALNERLRGRRIEAVNDAAGPLLFGDQPGDLNAALQALAQAEQQGLLARGTRARVAASGGAGLGLLGGPSLRVTDQR